mgnify:CR=1 FL=1
MRSQFKAAARRAAVSALPALAVIAACAFQYALFGVLIAIFARVNPFVFYRKLVTTQLMAFSTSSSKATLTTAMRECHVIEGKVTISPKAKLAMVRQQGLGRIWPDPGNDGESATWYAERDDLPGVRHSYTFTKAMATAAKLLPGKDKSAWSTYPERMLSWRACGYLLDDVFSEYPL